MDSDVQRSEELRRLEAARAEGRAEQARTERSLEETRPGVRHLEAPDREEGYAHRIAYDPGPSGTAVAGLIIGLIALAVALYAAFAPRETVREGSQAVTTAWQEAVDSEQPPAQPADRAVQPQAQEGMSASEIRATVAEETRKQMAGIRAELEKLRGEVVTGGRNGNAANR